MSASRSSLVGTIQQVTRQLAQRQPLSASDACTRLVAAKVGVHHLQRPGARTAAVRRTFATHTQRQYAQAASTTTVTKPSSTSSGAPPASRPSQATSTRATPTTPPSPLSIESDSPLPELQESDPSHIDWSKSFHGLSTEPFAKETADVLLAPLDAGDIEIKPDGIIYLPEIKYRRILNRAFGPGGWGLAPRGEAIVTDKAVTREYALLAHGRLVSIARGEQDYFNKDNIPTASEGCKSNAMMRCCKDLGVASELWDPRFIRKFKSDHTREVFVEHQVSKKKTKIWLRKGDPVMYPYKETRAQS